MPAKSQAQQRAMAVEMSRREAGKKPRRFTSMTTDQLEHFAATPRKNLPRRARPRENG